MRNLAGFIGMAAMLLSCTPTPDQPGWKVVGDLSGKIVFVEVEPTKMRSARDYSSAADAACGSGCTQVAFFFPGDLVPPPGDSASFFRNGGWQGYSPAAVKFGDDFTTWDCKRLDFPDAPSSALCGKNTERAYQAVLSIAVRDGWTFGCKLKPFGGYESIKQYASTLNEKEGEHVLKGYREMFDASRSGPDDPSFCETGRTKIERKAEDARITLSDFAKSKPAS